MDRILAIECAFYFDRRRFYRRAAQVLKPDGVVVLADIAFADPAAPVMMTKSGVLMSALGSAWCCVSPRLALKAVTWLRRAPSPINV